MWRASEGSSGADKGPQHNTKSQYRLSIEEMRETMGCRLFPRGAPKSRKDGANAASSAQRALPGRLCRGRRSDPSFVCLWSAPGGHGDSKGESWHAPAIQVGAAMSRTTPLSHGYQRLGGAGYGPQPRSLSRTELEPKPLRRWSKEQGSETDSRLGYGMCLLSVVCRCICN